MDELSLYEQNRAEDMALIEARRELRQVEENGYENYPVEEEE
jgi:hypothetical protein